MIMGKSIKSHRMIGSNPPTETLTAGWLYLSSDFAGAAEKILPKIFVNMLVIEGSSLIISEKTTTSQAIIARPKIAKRKATKISIKVISRRYLWCEPNDWFPSTPS